MPNGRVSSLPGCPRCAARQTPVNASSALILTDALNALADAVARAWLAAQPLLPARRGRRAARVPVAERWIAALAAASAQVELTTAEDEREAAELAAQLEAWHRAAQLPAGPVRTCFRLVEPETEGGDGGPGELRDKAGPDVPNGSGRGAPAGHEHPGTAGSREPARDWRVEFALQATDDPSLMMAAADVWAGGSAVGLAAGIQHPEEELLAGLAGPHGFSPSWTARCAAPPRPKSPSTPRVRSASCGRRRRCCPGPDSACCCRTGCASPGWASSSPPGRRRRRADR